jgi:hypothetical protein
MPPSIADDAVFHPPALDDLARHLDSTPSGPVFRGGIDRKTFLEVIYALALLLEGEQLDAGNMRMVHDLIWASIRVMTEHSDEAVLLELTRVLLAFSRISFTPDTTELILFAIELWPAPDQQSAMNLAFSFQNAMVDRASRGAMMASPIPLLFASLVSLQQPLPLLQVVLEFFETYITYTVICSMAPDEVEPYYPVLRALTANLWLLVDAIPSWLPACEDPRLEWTLRLVVRLLGHHDFVRAFLREPYVHLPFLLIEHCESDRVMSEVLALSGVVFMHTRPREVLSDAFRMRIKAICIKGVRHETLAPWPFLHMMDDIYNRRFYPEGLIAELIYSIPMLTWDGKKPAVVWALECLARQPADIAVSLREVLFPHFVAIVVEMRTPPFLVRLLEVLTKLLHDSPGEWLSPIANADLHNMTYDSQEDEDEDEPQTRNALDVFWAHVAEIAETRGYNFGSGSPGNGAQASDAGI